MIHAYTNSSDLSIQQLNAEEKKMLLGGEMPMWTDEYCYKHECINDQIPSAGWMYYGPKYDPQFTESVSSVVSFFSSLTKS